MSMKVFVVIAIHFSLIESESMNCFMSVFLCVCVLCDHGTCPGAGGILVAEVTTVIVPVTHPVLRDALPTGALKLSYRTGVNTAHLITAISAVIL